MMNKLLVLYPKEFKCFSKLNRKLTTLTQNMGDFIIITFSDHNGFLADFCSSEKDVLTVENSACLKNLNFTHAIVFDDGISYQEEISLLKVMGRPLRVIKVSITRVINIKNKPELNGLKSTIDYEYIGRGSYWGNPHSMYESFEDCNEDPREAVIRMFKYDFDYDKFLNIDKNKVYELSGKTLGCFCKPFLCHGDVLADYLNHWDDGK